MRYLQKGHRSRYSETESQYLLAVAAILLLMGIGCSPTPSREQHEDLIRSRFLMGTPLTITVPAAEGNDAAVEAAFDEVARVEALISTWRDDSALARINGTPIGETTEIDPELFDLLEQSVDWSHRTAGAFDPAAGKILFAWNLRGDGRIPTQQELELAVEQSGVDEIELDTSRRTITRRADVLIEEGGFGKGYALDRATEILREAGVERAMLDFGGQVTLFGQKTVTVGIADPRDRLLPAVEIEVSEGSVATSSGSERFFEAGGKHYSHILDPRNGRALPPRGSVTVVHESGLIADILATALYVMGPEEGLEWSARNNLSSVFITPATDGSWHVLPSPDASRSLSLQAIGQEFKIERKH